MPWLQQPSIFDSLQIHRWQVLCTAAEKTVLNYWTQLSAKNDKYNSYNLQNLWNLKLEEVVCKVYWRGMTRHEDEYNKFTSGKELRIDIISSKVDSLPLACSYLNKKIVKKDIKKWICFRRLNSKKYLELTLPRLFSYSLI